MSSDPPPQVTVKIDDQGNIVSIDPPSLFTGVGVIRMARASRITPASWIKRIAFRAVRAVSADRSAAASWTRTWRGPWVADLHLSGGPVLGPFRSRRDALEAERSWLTKHHDLVACGDRSYDVSGR